MKNYLIKHISVSAVLYTIAYLIYSFITWTAINPFKWLIYIDSYSEVIRILILFNIVIFNLIVSMIIDTCKVWKKWN